MIPRPKDYNGGNKSFVAADRGHDSPYRHHDGLLDLPNEILLHILGLLLPTGEEFHITPTTSSNHRLVSVHRVFRWDGVIPGSWEAKLNTLPILSAICRRLTAIAYTVVFGENKFVFEIATEGLTWIVSCLKCATVSWNKIVPAKPEGIAPLGKISTRYLRDLTLCVSLTCRLPSRNEWRRLEDSIQRVAQVFKGSGGDVRSLVVDVGFGRRTFKCVTTNSRLEMTTSNGLRMQVRNIENEGDTEPMTETMERLARLIAPLIFMEGVKDMRVSGILTAGTMHAYKAELLKRGKRMGEEFEDEPPAKRQKQMLM